MTFSDSENRRVYLTTKLRFTQAPVKPNGIIPFHQPDAERRWNEVFDRSLHAFNDIFAVDDCLNVLRYSSVSTYGRNANVINSESRPKDINIRANSILVHHRYQISLSKLSWLRCLPFP